MAVSDLEQRLQPRHLSQVYTMKVTEPASITGYCNVCWRAVSNAVAKLLYEIKSLKEPKMPPNQKHKAAKVELSILHGPSTPT